MAKVEAQYVEKVVERVVYDVKTVLDGFTLHLNREEAELLRAVLGKVSGGGTSWDIYEALADAGVESDVFTVTNITGDVSLTITRK